MGQYRSIKLEAVDWPRVIRIYHTPQAAADALGTRAPSIYRFFRKKGWPIPAKWVAYKGRGRRCGS